MKFKKRLAAFTACTMVWCTLGAGAVPAVWGAEESQGLPAPSVRNYEIQADIPVDDLYKEDEVYIAYKLSEPVPVYALDVKLSYDEEVLSFRSIKAPFDTETEGLRFLSNDENTIHYACSRKGQASVASMTEILLVTFTAKKAGRTAVTLQEATVVEDGLAYRKMADMQMESKIEIKEDKTTVKPGGGSRPGGGGGGGSRPSGGGSRPGGTVTVPDGTVTTGKKPQPTEFPDSESEAEKPVFSDLEAVPWAKDAILALAERGIIHGYQDGSFRPEQPVTRAEAAKLLNAVGEAKKSSVEPKAFTDVSKEAWYYEPVMAAAAAGIITGHEDGDFAPEDGVTREEFAAMLARCAAGHEFSLERKRLNINFTDEGEISPFAVGYVDLLYMAEVLSGDADGSFRPKDTLSRGEAAQGIYRLLVTAEEEKAESKTPAKQTEEKEA